MSSKGSVSRLTLRQQAAAAYYALLFGGLDAGVIPGQQSYTRFIVLGRPRTGSTWLLDALSRHKQVFTFGELFRHDLISWETHLGALSNVALADYSQQPECFLQERVFRRFRRHIQAVGFKIFYHHAQDPATRSVWAYLQTDRDLKVVHVKRRNLLETYLSHKTAWATAEWIKKSAAEPNLAPSLTLDYAECEQEFRTAKAQEEQFDEFFSAHQRIDVTYEDMVSSFEPQITRVEEFLGVKKTSVQALTLKQATRPLSQRIANYNELKEKFTLTPWASYFSE